MTRTLIVTLLPLIHQYSPGQTNGSRWWRAGPNHRQLLTSERSVSHQIRASSLKNAPFCAFLIGNTIAPHVAMAVTGPTLLNVVQDIGRSFDGNRDGAIKGAEKWAFLHEISSRMAPLIEQGAASIAGSTTGAPGTVGESTGLSESAPVGTSADQIDLSAVNWLDTNISSWAQTSTITAVSIGSPPINIEHTKAGQWPAITAGGTVVEGNPWIFAKVDGQWQAATYEWLRPGQTEKQISAENIGEYTKKAPLDGWQPKSGETVGLMVSTPARGGPDGPVNERSNVILVTWP